MWKPEGFHIAFSVLRREYDILRNFVSNFNIFTVTNQFSKDLASKVFIVPCAGIFISMLCRNHARGCNCVHQCEIFIKEFGLRIDFSHN